MSYVIQTERGRLIVIDGGTVGDTPYLRDFLKDRGNVVDMWFITHPHDDHCDALRTLILDPDALKIGAVYASWPEVAWVDQYADKSEQRTTHTFMDACAKTGRQILDLQLGEKLALDGVEIRVLAVRNPELRMNPINNQSIVLRIEDSHKSVLILGDLGEQAGNKLLKSKYAKYLKADYCQMAHHGQRGVTEEFYKAVQPKYCLWTAPRWLWDNDSGAGKGSGKWKTLETRAWMDKMDIRKHYVMCDGLQEIR